MDYGKYEVDGIYFGEKCKGKRGKVRKQGSNRGLFKKDGKARKQVIPDAKSKK